MNVKEFYSKFLEEHEEHGQLIGAVYDQLGCDSVEEFVEECENCMTPGGCGANAGFHGFIYYTETTEFYLNNRTLIIDLLTELSEGIGDSNIVETVLGFNSVDKDDPMAIPAVALTLYGRDDQVDQYIADSLAKFAFEEIAYWMSDFAYEDEIEEETED